MPNLRADVVVIQATPAGIAAALAAARLGSRVILTDNSAHVGGMMSNGLSVTDITTRGAVGGIFTEFSERVHQHYVRRYGIASPQERACNRGLVFEPHVAERIFTQMLQAEPRIVLLTRHQLVDVVTQGRKLIAADVDDLGGGGRIRLEASVFLDCTYEGDLAALAGATYQLGREARAETAEPYAGVVYMDYHTKRVYRGSTGEGDTGVQAYTYRLCMTRRPELRAPIPRPPDYRREDYASLIPDIQSGRLRRLAASALERDSVINAERLPNGKYDINNHHNALVSMDLPEENREYPEADLITRRRFARRLATYVLGLIWFCQHDPELPEEFRNDALQWGLATDEFTDNANFPRQMYVREARRIEGQYVFSAHDAVLPADKERPPIHRDAITAAHYMIDSHAFSKRQDQGEFRHRQTLDGFLGLDFLTHPYQVPYGVMVPRRVNGLLTPVTVSATHLGLCTLRMEPCWMALGQAAGTAAHLCQKRGVEPRDAPVDLLQRQLLKDDAVLCYCHDINPRHPYWGGLQYMGVRGFLPGYYAYANRAITRAQAAQWLRAALPDRPPGDMVVTYRDLRADDPAADAVVYLASHGILADDEPSDEFRPAESLTWKDLDHWLHRALGARLASLSVKPRADADSRPYLRRGEFAQAVYEAVAPFEGLPPQPGA